VVAIYYLRLASAILFGVVGQIALKSNAGRFADRGGESELCSTREGSVSLTTSESRALAGAHVMITGGIGLIGSALARRLVALGAEVLLIDSMVSETGGNFANIANIRDRLRVNIADIRRAEPRDRRARAQCWREAPYTLLALAEALVRANGDGHFERREFPDKRKHVDSGDFVTDDRRFRELTGCRPG
jgi:nucleoside-diphosphate-sugar epimerase